MCRRLICQNNLEALFKIFWNLDYWPIIMPNFRLFHFFLWLFWKSSDRTIWYRDLKCGLYGLCRKCNRFLFPFLSIMKYHLPFWQNITCLQRLFLTSDADFRHERPLAKHPEIFFEEFLHFDFWPNYAKI